MSLPPGTIHVVIHGFGAEIFQWQPGAYGEFEKELSRATGAAVLSRPSRRWGGNSRTDVNLREYKTPGTILLQARALRDRLVKAELADRPLFIHAHSLGGMVAVALGLFFADELNIVGINLVNTAGFDRLGIRRALWHVGVKRTAVDFGTLVKALAAMVLCRSGRAMCRATATAIIKYYMGMPLYVLANPPRAIAEAKATKWDVRPALSTLVGKVPIFIGLSPNDEVFDPGVTTVTLRIYGLTTVKTYETPGHHDPEYFAPGLVEAMREAGIL